MGVKLTYSLKLESALSALTEALRLLDEVAAPADVGAHVDLAIHRLQDVIQSGQSTQVAAH